MAEDPGLKPLAKLATFRGG